MISPEMGSFIPSSVLLDTWSVDPFNLRWSFLYCEKSLFYLLISSPLFSLLFLEFPSVEYISWMIVFVFIQIFYVFIFTFFDPSTHFSHLPTPYLWQPPI